MLGFGSIASTALADDSGIRALVLTADSGSFTTTGQTASFAFSATADVGTFTLTGQDSSVFAGFPISLNSGSFALTGQDLQEWRLVERQREYSTGE